MTTNSEATNQKLEASMSVLTMSIASSAIMSMGLTSDPGSGKAHTDKNMARFNIDLLNMLKEKTKSNLTQEESDFLSQVLQDLQMKFMQLK